MAVEPIEIGIVDGIWVVFSNGLGLPVGGNALVSGAV